MDGLNPDAQAEKPVRGATVVRSATIDGNEAVARVAYKTNEVCII